MSTIRLETNILAPIEICFDVSRSIDIHLESTKHTGETAIAGKTSGLIDMGESVTWRAKHLGVWQTFTSKITAFNAPVYFVDEMVQGAFASMKHEHIFEVEENYTRMIDVFQFESPLGILGKLVNQIFLTTYMRNFLIHRNEVIKTEAERLAKTQH
ncbi:SRPBCC family protein [Cytophaga aurantiaca]|uniref:SRPBCC family protein n=1 Tax=Cytophaga aurantiaca TaxID=29530 RepID=UPI000362C4C5|nr:SRPBCC family protein [Cytophaga aurantiaca]